MAKKKIEKTSRKESFDLRSLISEINGKYGDGTIVLGSEASNLRISKLPTGCHAIDFVSGGGIPENRITQIVGGYSAGKTTLVIKSMVQFQKKYTDGFCFIIDTEFAFDLAYAKVLGVDLSRLLVVQPDSGEDAVDLLMRLLKQDVPIYGTVDSIPGVIPLAEIESTVEQNFMGKHPMLINRMVKLANNRMKRSLADEDAPPTVLVLINQIREKIGLVFGNPETTPGGRGKDFFSGLILNLRGGEKLLTEIEKAGIKKKVSYGREYNVTVVKNKCGGRPHEETKYVYYTRNVDCHKFGEYNNAEVLFEYGVFNDLISTDNGFAYSCIHGKISTAKEKKFIEQLVKNPRIAAQLYRAIIKTIEEENLPQESEEDEELPLAEEATAEEVAEEATEGDDE